MGLRVRGASGHDTLNNFFINPGGLGSDCGLIFRRHLLTYRFLNSGSYGAIYLLREGLRDYIFILPTQMSKWERSRG